jgi:coniferyl-aldehyde dehydrogenase
MQQAVKKTNEKQDATELTAILQFQRQAFLAEGEVHWATRINRINRCIALLVDHSDKIVETVDEDFAGRSPRFNRMLEIMGSLNSLKHVKKNLKKWMKPERRSAPMPMNLLGARARVHYQPKGVVGIMTPWNFPVNMIFSPLADALGAGNRVMVKPSEHTPLTSELMQELFARYFEETEIAICLGGADTGAAFSALPLDHLIFTGGTEIGRMVLKSAAQNMTPTTLELGGKSPVIISTSANLGDAAEKIVMGKSMNSGQACISPDYVFLPEGKVEGFARVCRNVYARMYPTVVNNPDATSIINRDHYKRIAGLLKGAREQGARIEEINPANESLSPTSNRMPLSLVINPNQDAEITQQEIFGPLLVVYTYKNIDEVIDYINDHPRPLALYYFGRDRKERASVLSRTRSGGVSINDVMMHAACDDLPFGGIGDSGMGHYRGRDGFRTFSHARAVFHQGLANLAKLFGTLPPYGEKIDGILKSQIKY